MRPNLPTLKITNDTMFPLLHFGLQIKDGPNLQKPKKHGDSYQMIVTSLNYLHPLLGDEYTVTIHNDDTHTYKDDEPAYTLALETPTKKRELDYIIPKRDPVESGLSILGQAYYANASNKKTNYNIQPWAKPHLTFKHLY